VTEDFVSIAYNVMATDTDTDTLLKIQATNVQESMIIDNTMTHCIPRKINKGYGA